MLCTDFGEMVGLSEEDLAYIDEGTITISNNKFIMSFNQ